MKNSALNKAGNWLMGLGCLLPILFIAGTVLFPHHTEEPGNRQALENDVTVMKVYLEQQPGRTVQWPYMNEDDTIRIVTTQSRNSAQETANTCVSEFARLRKKDGYAGNSFVFVYDSEDNKLASASRP